MERRDCYEVIEFDSGSERTLVVGLTHASRTQILKFEWRPGEESKVSKVQFEIRGIFPEFQGIF